MSVVRDASRFVAAGMLVIGLAGCASGDASSGSDASPSVRAERSTSEHIDAEDLLAEPPDGLTYVDAGAEVEQQMRDQFDSSGASSMVDSFAVRAVESDSGPVGAVVAMVLNDQATSAFTEGILRGMEKEAGTQGQPIEIGGAPATYIEGSEAQALLYVGEDVVFMVFGQDRSDIEPILAALVEGAPSGT